MPVAVVFLLVTAVLPARATRWVDGLSQLALAAVTPISHPMAVVSRWLAPADRTATSGELEEARQRAERFEFLWRRERGEVERLRAIVEDLQSGRSFDTSVPVELAAFPVVGVSSDPTSAALRIRAGRSDGLVEMSTVATTGGTQLVGRVVEVGATLSIVLPINDPGSSQVIFGEVVVDGDALGSEGISRTLRCALTEVASGRLIGDAEVLDATPERPNPPRPAPGMVVRLSDSAWPASAQQLVIGVIEEVTPDEEQPLRPRIAVRPTVQLRRVGEVVLRIPVEDGGAG